MLTTVLNGKPTRPKVDKLMQLIADRHEGDIITHEEIAAIVGENRTNHYRAVVQAWRKRYFREHHIELQSEIGIGYRISTGYEQLRSSVRHMRNGTKKIAKGMQVAAVIADERLSDPNHRAARDYIVQQVAVLKNIAKSQRANAELVVGKPEIAPQMLSTNNADQK